MNEQLNREPIAIIGIGCRFPGNANDPEAFWKLLAAGIDAVSEVPTDRWSLLAYYDPRPGAPGKTYSKWGGFLEAVDRFEPGCFGISPREAAQIDPQQRFLLEAAWQALEDAGLPLNQVAETNAGVFVGVSTSDYAQLRFEEHLEIDPHSATGSAFSIAANRISYCLNLRGPSMTVDTACSSSLVAADLACRSLWDGRCDLALAGGANLILSPLSYATYCAANILSPTGRSRAFDASADGFVRGEGAGMVVLKRLSKALEGGDPVYALILGSGVNQDGRTAGLTMPSEAAQRALMEQVYAESGIAPADVDYVEAHGTGTPVGDPIEAHALSKVFSKERSEERPCLIGSVKTNIGHLEAAAGIAGLIKTILVLKHGAVPASLHFKQANPAIPLEALKLRVVQALTPLAKHDRPFIAAVNSFGFGGTNCHMLLTEHRAEMTLPNSAQTATLVPLSARSPEALKDLAAACSEWLTAPRDLMDVAYTAALRRQHYDHRLAAVASDTGSLKSVWAQFVNGAGAPGLRGGRRVSSRELKLAFVYSGQGPQWWAMGRELASRSQEYRAALFQCDVLLREKFAFCLLDELNRDETSSRIDHTAYAQPGLFALQYGLTQALAGMGLNPQALIGHSVGEVAAACASGTLSLDDAITVIYHRSRCMSLAPEGAMLAVGVGEEEALTLCAEQAGKVEIAAMNSPLSCTLTGDREALSAIAERLTAMGRFNRMLKVRHAFHSARMEGAKDDLLAALQTLAPRAPEVPIVSSVIAQWAHTDFDAAYWWRNVRQPVRFGAAVQRLLAQGFNCFIEIAPHPVLASAIHECAGTEVDVLPSLRRGEPELEALLGLLGSLYVRGYSLDWTKLNSKKRNCLRLPPHSWRGESYWYESQVSRQRRTSSADHPMLARRKDGAEPAWSTYMDLRLFPYLKDHRVDQQVVVPAAAYLELARAAVEAVLGGGGVISIENVHFKKALVIPETGEAPFMLFSYSTESGAFSVKSRQGVEDQEWTLHVTGYARREDDLPPPERLDLAAIRSRCALALPADLFYQRLEKDELLYGPVFRTVRGLACGDGEAIGQIALSPKSDPNAAYYSFHPALLDGCILVITAAIPRAAIPRASLGKRPYLPERVERIRFYRRPQGEIYSRAMVKRCSQDILLSDVDIVDSEGLPFARVEAYGCRAHKVGREQEEPLHYELRWRSLASSDGAPPDPWRMSPKPSALAQEMRQYARDSGERLGFFTTSLEAVSLLERMAFGYLLKAWQELGVAAQPGDRLALQELEAAVATRFHRLLPHLLGALVHAGFLRQNGQGNFQILKSLKADDPDAGFREALVSQPGWYAEIDLVARCGRKLGSVLRGEVDALTLLFPDGDMGSAEHIYQDSRSSRHYNLMLAQAARQLGTLVKESRKLRVLEVGAGTGGLTRHVLTAIADCTESYLFTDVSPVFLNRAQQQFRDHPFMEFQLFDVERSPVEQNLPESAFDVVLASEVLHATRDLRSSLQHLRRLLASHGVLMFLENERGSLWIDITFGLQEGWWRFADFDLRADYPLLESRRWLDLLRETGFEDPAAVGGAGQAVIIARAPGASDRQAQVAQQDLELARGDWLIFTDRGGLGQALAQRLKSAAQHCVCVLQAHDYEGYSNGAYRIKSAEREHMSRLYSEASQVRQCQNIVFLWGLDAPAPGTDAELESAEAVACHSLVYLLQALPEDVDRSRRIIIVTRYAQPTALGGQVLSLSQTPLVGMMRNLRNERAEACRWIDVGGYSLEEESAALCAELLRGPSEGEVVLRPGHRLVPELQPQPEPRVAAWEDHAKPVPFALDNRQPGVLDKLALVEVERGEPRAGEIEIEVAAAGLNFRDILKALNLYPTEDLADKLLGDECAGTVVAVGEGVRQFVPGDAVFAIAPGSFASYVTTRQEFAFHKPAALSFEEAAGLPIAFLTAHYCLIEVANLKPGETVLIQSAAGGVGLAALQIAKGLGARVYATAGNTDKRELLAALGAEAVMDSRSLSFAEQVMRHTGGRGVDVVLNSLSGRAIAKGLSCLAPYGRFIEIGKRDIYEDARLSLWPFRKNISFSAVDLSRVFVERPRRVRELFTAVCQGFTESRYHALPHRVFPIANVRDAFKSMAKGRHVGKLVVTMFERQANIRPRHLDRFAFKSDATYLITGGLGGFGLALAHWMAENGARHLVLLGRRGVVDDTSRQAVVSLQALGAQVRVIEADVSRFDELARAYAEVEAELPPLRGVIHAAMVLDDALVANLDATRFHAVMAPKVAGAWNLHRLTTQAALDFFVLFSSMSAVGASAGQSNYAAANAFLDGLAHYRRAQGLPALSVNWGSIGDVGYVARVSATSESLARRVGLPVAPAVALAALARLLNMQAVQAAVVRVDRSKFAAQFPAGVPRMLASLVTQGSSDAHSAGPGQIKEMLSRATPSERIALAKRFVHEQVASVLGASIAELEPERPLGELGLDSLVSVELKSRIGSTLGVTLPAGELAQEPTVEKLAMAALRLLDYDQRAPASACEEAAPRVVALKTGDASKLVFCIHATGGDVSVYKSLVEVFPPSVAVFGVKSRLLAGAKHEYPDIAQMASAYARAIRERQPEGPYKLIGFSLGGFIANRIAAELEAQGETVSLLGLIEADLALTELERSRDLDLIKAILVELTENLLDKLRLAHQREHIMDSTDFGKVAEAWLDLPWAKRGPAVLEWLTRHAPAEQAISKDVTEAAVGVFIAHVKILFGFTPRAVQAPLHIWRASGRAQTGERWADYALSECREYTFAGGHFDWLKLPAVETVAAQICAALGCLDPC